MKHILFLLLSGMLLAGAAQARPTWNDDQPHRYTENSFDRKSSEHRGISLDAAVAKVRRETGGRILSAETVNQGGRRVHRIKVLTPDKRVRIINVDAGR
jgi:uncharacterized membrane protein YkoI